MTRDDAGRPPYGINEAALNLYLQLAEGEPPGPLTAELAELIDAGLLEWDAENDQATLTRPELAIHGLRDRHLTAVEALLREMADRLTIHRQLPQLLHTVVDSLDRATPLARPGSVTHLVGKDTINTAAGQLMATATEFRSGKPGGAQSAATLAASYERDLAHLRAHPGMLWRTLYSGDARTDPATCQWAQDFTAAGGEVRTTDRPFARWMIFGRSDALVTNPLMADNTGAIHISDVATVTALVQEWDLRYLHCRPFTGPDAPGGIYLTEEQLLIIHGILEQRPRKALATSLGITDKTLARRIAGIEKALGVAGDGAIGYAYAQWEDRQRITGSGPA